MELTKENTTRKIDSLGRISIPKSVRSRMNIEEGQEMQFYMLRDDAGTQYVCMRPDGDEVDPKYVIAYQVLEDLGVEVPEELKAML